eukprot:CAMPEP_0117420558 /NCGR_PEP_ID=MMETSP0758-20121206/1868_1 /TAXON_ID=63605 /ORGANISM="Percolomonas cosmopolitus, Strain AE-1 (ATCC 50343)" /LENGTH=702 /DNA_ID=CAMNT_0005202239 /DNA_START=490 /DNA_END=2594 /DNA_ORIENTATION=-
MEILSMTIHDYIAKLGIPSLNDLLVTNNLSIDTSAFSNESSSKSKLFTPYWSSIQIKKALAANEVVQGKISIRPGSQKGFVELNNGKRISINSYKYINRSIDGDVVVIQHKDQEGEVVGVVKRNWRIYCGSIDEETEIKNNGSQWVFFVPVDRKIPKIRIRTSQAAELITKRITVAIDSWDINSTTPQGHYISTIGEIGEIETETEVVLREANVPHYEFPEEVMACLPKEDWTISSSELSKRKDYRYSRCVVSVDPPGCKDIDDALHAKLLPNGNLEIGVHIADVTHFVKENSALDAEAAHRSTSVYLVHKRIDMLPKVLTEQLCSLRANVNRLAFSCIWEINPNTLEIISNEFHKSVIRSRAAFTYEQAQNIIDNQNDTSEIAVSLRLLQDLGKKLRKRRFEAGALALASPAVKFGLDTDKNPTDLELYQLRETNSTVEEFMLLANQAASAQMLKMFPHLAVLRRHPPPDSSRFESLLKSLNTRGLSLDVASSKGLNDTLEKIALPGNDYVNTIVRMLVTRCMQQAKYFSSGDRSSDEYYHYGLAMPIYTHFTSPIRRYADVLVHRLLGCTIGIYSLSKGITERENMRKTLSNTNERTRMAQIADRESISLYTLIFFKEKDIIADASVMSVDSKNVQVFIQKYGFSHELTSHENENWTFDEENEILTNNIDENLKLQIFDKIQVRIRVVVGRYHRSRLNVS